MLQGAQKVEPQVDFDAVRVNSILTSSRSTAYLYSEDIQLIKSIRCLRIPVAFLAVPAVVSSKNRNDYSFCLIQTINRQGAIRGSASPSGNAIIVDCEILSTVPQSSGIFDFLRDPNHLQSELSISTTRASPHLAGRLLI